MLEDQAIEHSPPEGAEVSFNWIINEVQINGVTKEQLATAEWVLNKLTREERVELATCEQEYWPPFFKKLGPQHETVHLVFDEMYNLMMT
jgi:hypothetical protein